MEGLEEERVHPLQLPSVVTVLVEHLESSQLPVCRMVSKVWSDEIRRNTSPLLNERVLSLVLKHISKKCILPQDMLRYKLVCQLWNSSVFKFMLNRSRSTDHDDLYWTNVPIFFNANVGSGDFERFSSKFPDPQNLIEPFLFSTFTAFPNVSLNDPSTQDFLSDYGRFIKYLELERCKWTLEDLRTVLFENCVNLESLKIVCGVLPGTQVGKGRKVSVVELETVLHEDPCDFKKLERLRSLSVNMNILDSKDNVRAYVEQFLEELFQSCPNLETIQFDFTSWYARTWATNFLTNDNVALPRLSVLDHLIDPDLNTVQNLTKKAFPLKKLKIRIRYKDVTVKALHDLLRSLANTLEDLQLVFMDYTCAREFPSSRDLVKLKRFELWRYKGQLAFLKDFRGLEELVLGEIELKGQEVFKTRGDVIEEFRNVEFKDYWEVRVFS